MPEFGYVYSLRNLQPELFVSGDRVRHWCVFLLCSCASVFERDPTMMYPLWSYVRSIVLLVCVVVLASSDVLAQWASGFGDQQDKPSDSWSAGFQQAKADSDAGTRSDWIPTSSAKADESDESAAKKRENRYYVVAFYKFGCGPCERWKTYELPKLTAAGIDVVRVDSEQNPKWGVGMNPTFWIADRTNETAVKQYDQGEYKSAAALLTAIEECNEPQSSCTAEVVQKPVSTGVNPVGAVYDGEPGSSHQSRSALISHLQSGVHAGKFTARDLEAMSDQELSDLHDADHNYRSGTKYLHWTMPTTVVKPAASTNRVYYQSSCPNGNCGNMSSNRRQRERGFLFFRW